MFINCELAMLILALTLGGQVIHSGGTTGAREVVPHSWPYMALLQMTMSDGSQRYCGGFLLNEDFVMTAAHCQAKCYTVLLGLHNMYKNEKRQKIPVEQAFPHKDYNESTYINDVMLLKLSVKAHFNDNVKPIALASGDDGSLPKSCRISGWGRDKRDNPYLSSTLREVNMRLINDDRCTKRNMYCSEGKTGPLGEDGGGPLVCEDGKAYGVVSSTYRPLSGGPQIHQYAKIPDYRSWISSTIKNAEMKMLCM